jgi:hypothetical protein
VIRVFSYQSIVNSGGGNDRVSVKGRFAQVNVGEGNNLVDISGDDASVKAGSGNDIIRVSDGFSTIDAGDGNNQINLLSRAGFHRIKTGAGNDFVVMNSSGSVDLGEGNNFIQLNNDVLYGNVVQISAGRGKNVFSLGKTRGTVTIEGYNNKDKISLASLAGVIVQQDGTDVKILDGDRLTVTVKNTRSNDIHLAVGLTRPLSSALQDPFNARMPLAIAQQLNSHPLV